MTSSANMSDSKIITLRTQNGAENESNITDNAFLRTQTTYHMQLQKYQIVKRTYGALGFVSFTEDAGEQMLPEDLVTGVLTGFFLPSYFTFPDYRIAQM